MLLLFGREGAMRFRAAYLSLCLLLCCVINNYVRAEPADPPSVYCARLEGDTINPITAEYIIACLRKAETAGSECVILELDTPGGLLTSTRAIVKAELSAAVPCVVYVAPAGSRAGSAGVFIAYASHVAAMAPSTNIGAAHPVTMGGGFQGRSFWKSARKVIESASREDAPDNEDAGGNAKKKEIPADDDVMTEKVLHDTAALIKALASRRGRNVEWAVQSVTESDSITENEALEQGVIEIIAADRDDLLRQLDGRTVSLEGGEKMLHTAGARVIHLPMTTRQRILNVLANPNIAYILLILGFYGLLFEVTHPGVGFPGVAGAIFIILAFFSMHTLPTNYAGLALVIVGIILFIAEAQVPGLGLLTLGGLVAMVLGSLLLFDASDESMRVSLSLIAAFSVATALITFGLVRAVVRAHTQKVLSGKEGLINQQGTAETALTPGKRGKIFAHGELWNAVSEEPVEKGADVIVTSIDGMTVTVRKKKT